MKDVISNPTTYLPGTFSFLIPEIKTRIFYIFLLVVGFEKFLGYSA